MPSRKDGESLILQREFSPANFLKLGSVVLCIACLSIGSVVLSHADPILATKQMLSRLFPVKRGLLHAYWAPNFWALYAFVDKVLDVLLGKQSGGVLTGRCTPSADPLVGGLVGEVSFSTLPNIHPLVTLVVTMAGMTPALLRVWDRPHPRAFLSCLVFCTLTSVMFGYHVHEKASLMGLIPLTMVCCDSAKDARLYVLLSWVSALAWFVLTP